MQDSLTFYKLIILYSLSRVKHPLTQSQMSDFVLDAGYMTYLQFREAMAELNETGLIREEIIRNRTFISLTAEGQEASNFFTGRLDEDIKKSINEYLKKNEMELINELAVTADCYRLTSGEYEAAMVIHERDSDLLTIKLNFPTEDLAQAACNNFTAKNQDIYQLLLKLLMD